MPSIDLRLDVDGCWADIGLKRQAGLLRISETAIGLALLCDGMTSGRASVSLRVDLPDGQCALAQTSLRALAAAVRAMEVRARLRCGPEPADQMVLED